MEGVADRVAFIRQRAQAKHEGAYELVVDVKLVRRNPNQPRIFFDNTSLRNLARSIKQVGQKVPIMVMSVKDDPKHQYEIIDGERRWRACQIIGRPTIRAFVYPLMPSDEQFVQSVVSNFGREGHTAYETALALDKLHNMGHSADEIAAMFAKSTPWVYQHLSLVKLHAEVVAFMDHSIPERERLPFSIALLLTTLPKDLQIKIAKEIVGKKMKMMVARHLVKTKASEAGHRVGSGKRPNRSRQAVVSYLRFTAEGAPTFLNSHGLSFEELLLLFPDDGMAQVLGLAREARDGIEKMAQLVEETAKRRGIAL